MKIEYGIVIAHMFVALVAKSEGGGRERERENMTNCMYQVWCITIEHPSDGYFLRGAGQEVGRSCIMLEFKGKKIMVSNSVIFLLFYSFLNSFFFPFCLSFYILLFVFPCFFL